MIKRLGTIKNYALYASHLILDVLSLCLPMDALDARSVMHEMFFEGLVDLFFLGRRHTRVRDHHYLGVSNNTLLSLGSEVGVALLEATSISTVHLSIDEGSLTRL